MDFNNLPTRCSVLKKLFLSWIPSVSIENILVSQSIGRITAQSVYSKNTLPVVRNSMSDGVAVSAARFASGIPDTTHWKEGVDYARADTGDDFDDRFDAVIVIENIQFTDNGGIKISDAIKGVKPGDKVRVAGDTIKTGELLIAAGVPIRPIDLSLLVMGGIETIDVIKKPLVSFIPTGSELVAPGTVPKRGQNIDTNSIFVKHMLIEMGAQPLCYSIVKDHQEQLAHTLDDALQKSDIVIINGGSSKGAEDFNARLLKERGTIICHGVAAAPGKPMCIAIIDDKVVINLPGPLAAAFYGVQWCVSAVVYHYLGIPAPQRQQLEARMSKDVRFPAHMEILGKVTVTKNKQGFYDATPRSFGDRSLFIGANGMFISHSELYAQNTPVQVELLQGIEYINHSTIHATIELKRQDVTVRNAVPEDFLSPKKCKQCERQEQPQENCKKYSPYEKNPEQVLDNYAQNGIVWLAIEQMQTVIGKIRIQEKHPCVANLELTTIHHEQAQYEQSFKIALQMLIDYLFGIMPYDKISTLIYASDKKGKELFETLGFKKERLYQHIYNKDTIQLEYSLTKNL